MVSKQNIKLIKHFFLVTFFYFYFYLFWYPRKQILEALGIAEFNQVAAGIPFTGPISFASSVEKLITC